MKKLKKILSLFLICVVAIMSLPFVSSAATVGQSLASPEDGWQRYQYDCGKINFYGTKWGLGSQTLSYVSQWQVKGAGFKFKFSGTKFRIVAAKWSTFSKNITVKIDGVNVDTASFYSSSNVSAPVLMYEKTGLDSGEHEVEFINNTAEYLSFFAVDIDDTGSLLEYDKISSLTATASESTITLNWDIVENAASYNIYRSTTKGGPYNTVYNTSNVNSFVDTDVTPGTIYYYVVSAIVSNNESSNSNEVYANIEEKSISSLKVVAEVGENIQLSVNNDLSQNTIMTWTSSDSSIASVDSQGVVTGVAPDNAVITVTNADGTYKETINILVIESELQLAVDLNIGDTRRLTVDDLTDTVNATWTSNDETIATVDSKGKVTAVSPGTTFVTVKDDQGNEIGKIYVRVRN